MWLRKRFKSFVCTNGFKIFLWIFKNFVCTIKYGFKIFLGLLRSVCTIKYFLKYEKPRLHYKIFLALKYFQILRLHYEIYFITPPRPLPIRKCTSTYAHTHILILYGIKLNGFRTRKTRFSRSCKTVPACPIRLKLFPWTTKTLFLKNINFSLGKHTIDNCEVNSQVSQSH